MTVNVACKISAQDNACKFHSHLVAQTGHMANPEMNKVGVSTHLQVRGSQCLEQ